jgi:hypothetical protein
VAASYGTTAHDKEKNFLCKDIYFTNAQAFKQHNNVHLLKVLNNVGFLVAHACSLKIKSMRDPFALYNSKKFELLSFIFLYKNTNTLARQNRSTGRCMLSPGLKDWKERSTILYTGTALKWTTQKTASSYSPP